MEVHAHTHTERKKFTHYLWEFLMLFLAVFAGFLAENLRERKVEKNRAEELALSFYSELQSDSAAVHSVMENRIRRDSAFNYLQQYFTDSSILNCSKAFAVNFYYGFVMLSPFIFEPKDAILDQLKNSGSLRYFKNIKLQKLTGDLSEAIVDLRKRNDLETYYSNNQMIPYVIKHNDMGLYKKIIPDVNLYLIKGVQKYESSEKIFPFRFHKPESFDKIEAINLAGTFQVITRGSTDRQYMNYEMLNHQLLEEIHREYHLK
jgi:hypothetical protein